MHLLWGLIHLVISIVRVILLHLFLHIYFIIRNMIWRIAQISLWILSMTLICNIGNTIVLILLHGVVTFHGRSTLTSSHIFLIVHLIILWIRIVCSNIAFELRLIHNLFKIDLLLNLLFLLHHLVVICSCWSAATSSHIRKCRLRMTNYIASFWSFRERIGV